MRIDADEIVEKNFFYKFNKIKNKKKYNGIDLNIDHIFLGDKINYGGVYPQNQIRIWKKNKGYFDKSPMFVSSRRLQYFKSAFFMCKS